MNPAVSNNVNRAYLQLKETHASTNNLKLGMLKGLNIERTVSGHKSTVQAASMDCSRRKGIHYHTALCSSKFMSAHTIHTNRYVYTAGLG